jgi:hypothetical protein
VLLRIEIKQARAITMANGIAGHHLCIEAGVAGNQAQEKPVMPIGPVHHGRNAKCEIGLHAPFSPVLRISASVSACLHAATAITAVTIAFAPRHG